MQIKPASGAIEWLLRKRGFAGVTLPWAIYILPERINDPELRAHELAHANQIHRMGVARFYLSYLIEAIRYGYKKMPLEIEAREASKKPPVS